MNKTNKNGVKKARKKPISMRNEHFLVDDQGAFAALKEKLWFSEPFYGFSSLLNTKKKHLKEVLFLWWTIRDSKPDSIAKMSQNEQKTCKKCPF